MSSASVHCIDEAITAVTLPPPPPLITPVHPAVAPIPAVAAAPPPSFKKSRRVVFIVISLLAACSTVNDHRVGSRSRTHDPSAGTALDHDASQ